MENVASSTGGIDLLRAVSAGIRLVGGLSTPAKVPERRILDLMLCSPPLNYIQLRQWSYAAAVVENAGHLRLAIEILVDEDALSPFHVLSGRDSAGNETKDSTSDATSASSRTVPITDSIKPNLKPTAIQLNTAHHPCYDLLPWPAFRSKAIMAISANPPLIDEEDLCMDILNDGIFCWGSTGPSMHSRGGGVPWDARSWEAAPWFLQKWESLTDGRNGDMWRTSEWWRCMRS